MVKDLYFPRATMETALGPTAPSNYNDLLNAYLISLGWTNGTVNDKLVAFLLDAGYSGTLSDMWTQYESTL